MNDITLTGRTLPLADLVSIADGRQVRLSDAGLEQVRAGQTALGDALARGDGVYGTTSMVGAFKDAVVTPEDRPHHTLRPMPS